MNSVVPDTSRWSVRRWIYAVTAMFALQAGLLLYVGQRELAVPVRPTFRTAVSIVSDSWYSEQLDRILTMNDPTLFALPGESGFSSAWLQPAPLEYVQERWAEPLHWLALDKYSLGSDFVRSISTNVLNPPSVAEQVVPPPLRHEPHFPSEAIAQQSRLRFEGELAPRALPAPVRLRSWPRPDILSNSVVRTAIDADGRTLFPTLVGESGLPEADQQALKLAAGVRFRPLPRAARDATGFGPLAWGKMVFEWTTVLPAATNLPVNFP